MNDEAIDTREMLAVHQVFRKEFAALPLRVKSVAEGDAVRAGIVGAHVLLMITLLQGHHQAEDDLLWPLLLARAPGSAAVVATLEGQHEHLEGMLGLVQAQARTWIADTNIQTRSTLHTSLIALERALLEHLSLEEMEATPFILESLTAQEVADIGGAARASLTPEQLAIGLGLIVDDNPADIGGMILDAMPAGARAAFEEVGRPAYRQYRDRLMDNA